MVVARLLGASESTVSTATAVTSFCADLSHLDRSGEVDFDGPAVSTVTTLASTTPSSGEVFVGIQDGAISPLEVLSAAGIVAVRGVLARLPVRTICFDDALVVELIGVDFDISAALPTVAPPTTVSTISVDLVEIPPRTTTATAAATTMSPSTSLGDVTASTGCSRTPG
jgi:hypothetical protein